MNKKKVSKKSLLFIIPVAVIGVFLLGKTSINTIMVNSKKYKDPINSNITDEYFAACALSAYNEKYETYKLTLADEDLPNITELDCSNMNIQDTSGIELMTGLESLDLSDNRIESIDLSSNTALTSLNLSNNPFHGLANITGLSSLISLDNLDLSATGISGNLVKSAAEAEDANCDNCVYFDAVNTITILSLANNNITSIDISLRPALVNLNLNHNGMTELDLHNNINIETLDLSWNSISGLSNISGFGSLNAMQSLNLAHNDIAGSIGSNFTVAIGSLSEIDLSDNQLESVNLSGRAALTKVNLSGNSITSLNVYNDTSITHLDLSNNQIDGLSRINGFGSLNALQSLNLSHNELADSISYFTVAAGSLIELDLSYNQLEGVDFSNSSALTDLNLSNNNLSSVDFAENQNLTNLNLQENNIEQINLSSNVALTNLNLSHNKLKSIDLSSNVALTELDLRYNKLKDINLSNGGATDNYYISNQSDTYYIYNNDYAAIGDEALTALIEADQNGLQSSYVDQKHASLVNNEALDYDYTYNLVGFYLSITNDAYTVGNNNDYILTGTVTSNSTILDNIRVVDGDSNDLSDVNYDINDDKLVLTVGDSIIKEFDLIKLTSDYDLSGDSITVTDSNIDSFLDNITCTNCDLYVYDGNDNLSTGDFASGDKLRIMHGESLVGEYDLEFAVISVEMNKDVLYLDLQQTTSGELSATAFPAYASNQNLVWESSDDSVATVENGVVTAHDPGSATIKAKVDDGSIYSTCTVIVTATPGNLSFEDYTIVNDSRSNEYIISTTNINVSNLNLGLGSEYTVSVFEKNGTTAKTSGKLGTEDVIKVYYNNKLVRIYIVVIRGDNNGDGSVDVSDVANVYKYLKGKGDLNYPRLLASNVNGDALIDVSDVSNIYKFIKGKINF